MTNLLSALLSPAIRFCVRAGIHLPQLTDLLKRCLVVEARRQIEHAEKKVTVSRISVMTGVSRREVTEILSAPEEKEPPPNILARVVQKWRTDRRFRMKSGNPRTLSIGGTASEFSKLAGLVSQDLNPATVLFELERLKLVQCDKDKGVAQLVGEIASYAESPERKLELLSRNMHSLVTASEANTYAPNENPELVLRTEFDNLVHSALPELKAWVREEGLAFHRRLREKLSQYDKDLSPQADAAGGGKIVVVAFSHVEADFSDANEGDSARENEGIS